MLQVVARLVRLSSTLAQPLVCPTPMPSKCGSVPASGNMVLDRVISFALPFFFPFHNNMVILFHRPYVRSKGRKFERARGTRSSRGYRV